MNKTALTEYVRTAILKSEAVADNQKVVHFKRVEQAVVYAFDTLLSQIQLTEKGISEIESYYVKHYYGESVSESGGYRYVPLSDEMVPVGEGKGIWYVQPQGKGKAFSRSRRPKVAMFRSLPVGDAMAETFWRVGNLGTKQQIVFENIGDSPFRDIRKVDYGIVRSLNSYEGTEEVRVPDGRMDLLIQMCMSWFGQRYNDITNNDA